MRMITVPDPKEALAIRIVTELRDQGWIAYWAGGCVRDKLLGLVPKDYDIATNATPSDILRLYPKAQSVGAHFGVILVVLNHHHFEIATFREDGAYTDGRHPESVVFTTPENDALRRDFTINALFLDPLSGEIIDFVEGRKDLEARVVRSVGAPARRFAEDHLRLIRAIRFATVLDFSIEPETAATIQQLSGQLATVSMERIRDEFSKILQSPGRLRGINLLMESGLLAVFLPEFLTLKGCEQPPQFHPEGDVLTHVQIMLDHLAPDAPLEIVLAVLLHDIAKPPTQTIDETGRIRFNGHAEQGAEMAEEILRRLKYPNAIINAVVEMVRCHMMFKDVQFMRVARLKRFMARPTFPWEVELHRVDCLSSNGLTDNLDFVREKATQFANEPLIPPPLISGADLLAMGLAAGPLFKEILTEAQTLQLENVLTTREEALIWLEKKREDSPAIPN
jgi:putative nucleotidyltransferase with HDIG domain